MNTTLLNEDLKIKDLAKKIQNEFAPIETAAVLAVKNSLGALLDAGVISADAYQAAINAAAKKSGQIDRVCSLPRVLAIIRRNYRNEFETVCACSFDSLVNYYRQNGGKLATFSPSLSLSLVNSASDINDFVHIEPIEDNASVASVVSAVLSFRHYYKYQAAKENSISEEKNAFNNALADVYRMGVRLGLDLDEIRMKLEEISLTTEKTDANDRARLKKNLEKSWTSLKSLEASLVLAGCPGYIEIDGGFVFSSSLPASCPAKVRRLWAKRERKLSSIRTLDALLDA